MDDKKYQTYVEILKSELVMALGCTEPIAIAFAAAKARELLGKMPERIEVHCSGNIVKNVKGVTVPNSNGMKGIDAAALLGMTGGDASRELAVLETVTQQDIELTKKLLVSGACICKLVENVENLYILVNVFASEDTAQIEIRDYHSNITRAVKNNSVIFEQEHRQKSQTGGPDKSLLNVRDILRFADEVRLDDVREVIQRQISCNTAISQEGLNGSYGAQVGKTLVAEYPVNNAKLRAKAAAAAGSDARMSGCALPVVINSGSGNQGITASLPVIEYAKEYNCTEEQLIRALVVSNLISIHQKKYIGSLSAYCGAVSAACGAGAGISYMLGGSYEEVSDTITNTIANIGGMVCDGAKPSCAAKIASAVDAAIMAWVLSRNNHVFRSGEGLVKDDVEETIASVGRMGREGMKSTDIEILNIMLEK